MSPHGVDEVLLVASNEDGRDFKVDADDPGAGVVVSVNQDDSGHHMDGEDPGDNNHDNDLVAVHSRITRTVPCRKTARAARLPMTAITATRLPSTVTEIHSRTIPKNSNTKNLVFISNNFKV